MTAVGAGTKECDELDVAWLRGSIVLAANENKKNNIITKYNTYECIKAVLNLIEEYFKLHEIHLCHMRKLVHFPPFMHLISNSTFFLTMLSIDSALWSETLLYTRLIFFGNLIKR